MVSSKSGVRRGLDRIAEIDEEIEGLVAGLRAEREAIKAAVDKYVIDHYEPGDGYEDDEVKVTKVVSHTRRWNPDKLKKLVPTGVFKNLVKVEVIPAKIDEYVRAGRIDRKKIDAAFEEVPNAPYTKVTRKKDSEAGAREADELAAKLGV